MGVSCTRTLAARAGRCAPSRRVLAHTGQAIRYDGVEMSLSGARAIQTRSLIAVASPPAIAPACNESLVFPSYSRLVPASG